MAINKDLKTWQVHLNADDYQRLERVAESIGVVSRQRISVEALRLGLDALEKKNPQELLELLRK